ncbi:3-deoxy-7-phosphoheptulonate synthase [Saccharicrinis fermentans]|uniref:Phospho-2-dehydro-3-deoxyheptonate aldolase n=1 Tax=Saccharicrinis fermentans DSM 9555 = JCM 21142 TaxID=869213 RepID=W7YHH4_9BACT|nr:3-deoxy-7-phosphoheptulonate synthase [Saccharicrinis fermentans]GAF02019.1 phospho-2-dehydro-3-deoxyheptonate aldolase [Saccharicrinis fermentans DSM 9555 = JCM 21142]
MTDKRIENINVSAEDAIITPNQLKDLYPLNENIIRTIEKGQGTIKNILSGEDKRILVVVGPCSIHDIDVAKAYAQKLKKLADELSDTLYLVMRVYFEKPRTTVGWQGLINDPFLDDSHQLEEGLKQARELLTYIAEIGLPVAGEALDIVTPQYIQDLISWTAIGARTTESQSHRKMASGLSSVVGFKNGTDGNIKIAVNALESVASPHNFISIDPDGHVAVVRTKGNSNTHIILRGGKEPNYDSDSVARYEKYLAKVGLPTRMMIDCSHANSNKKAANQRLVLKSIEEQIKTGNKSIMGVMIESNLFAGKQSIPADITTLQYGVSVTDECIGWDETEELLKAFATSIQS